MKLFLIKYKFILFIGIIAVFPFYTFAQINNKTCSQYGYTIATINGVLTDDVGAKNNKKALQKELPPYFNNEPLVVEYLLNPSHGKGVLDFTDVLAQKLFDTVIPGDYDLDEMPDVASQKIATQKLLFVGHSQGNFYANALYDKLADQYGGVPKQSIGVYAVATPADHVAGGGFYLTSHTDKVIAGLVGNYTLRGILTPNTYISEVAQEKDSLAGHSFSDVYIKYRYNRIKFDILNSLNRLQSNSFQYPQKPCIAPQSITLIHQIEGVVLSVVDHPVDTVDKVVTSITGFVNEAKTAVTGVAVAVANTFSSFFSRPVFTVKNVGETGGASVVLADASADIPQTEPTKDASPIIEKEKPTLTEVTKQENKKETPLADMVIQSTPEIFPPLVVSPPSIFVARPGGIHIIEIVAPEPNTIPPVITLSGSNVVNLTLNDVYMDAGATAEDDIDGVRTVLINGTVDTSIVGIYTMTYIASDLSNNLATATRTVNVHAPSSDKTITAFSIATSVDTTINQNVRTITVTVPTGTDITNLITNIIHTGASIYPENGIATDFSNPVTYIITATDSSKQNYVVIVDVTPPPSADYLDTMGNLVNGNVLYLSSSSYSSGGYGRVWYNGNYPDISNPIDANNYPNGFSSSTLPCGYLCNRTSPQYMWLGIYSDNTSSALVHYVEVHYTGGPTDQWNHYDITNQGNIASGTCSDGVKNQDETDVDIGGICILKTIQLSYTCATNCDYLDVPGKIIKGSVLYISSDLYSAGGFGRQWYSGRYPNVSNPDGPTNNYPDGVYIQTLPCGNLCNVQEPKYFWMGVYEDATNTNLAHYVEVYYAGGPTDRADYYYITAQSE